MTATSASTSASTAASSYHVQPTRENLAAVGVVSPASGPPKAIPSAATSSGIGRTAAMAYDLEGDRNARTKLAKEELGPRIPLMYVAPIFVVAGGGGHSQASLAADASLIDRALVAYLNGRFAKGPEQAISVYLFPDPSTYHAYCQKHYGAQCISRFGFYEPSERKMVMNGAGGTLTHELVHPMVEADFPRAPIWLNEGIASLFEQPIIPRAGEIHGGKNWRLPRLLAGISTKAEQSEARLDALFAMSDTGFRNAREDLHYALARYVCQWLDGQNKLWDFYHQFRDHFDDDPSGRKAFETVVGMPTEQAAPLWQRWVHSL